MKICIVSDSHDHRGHLAAAVADAKARGAQAVLHCGDLVAPSTLHAITPLGLPIHVVHGNNTGDLFHLARIAHESNGLIRYYGQDGAFTLHGRRIFMVHYPHYAKAMALTGDYDLVCNGHEHRAVIERVKAVTGGESLRLDPGTVAGIGAPPTYILGDLEKMEFAIQAVPLPGDTRAVTPKKVTRP
ncbi:MAG: metallophosphoesterase family protein [Gammaproteobacteria bacterium]|nr:metallophosphoesterase family protein [Gammaproteobacteria bacterium]